MLKIRDLGINVIPGMRLAPEKPPPCPTTRCNDASTNKPHCPTSGGGKTPKKHTTKEYGAPLSHDAIEQLQAQLQQRMAAD